MKKHKHPYTQNAIISNLPPSLPQSDPRRNAKKLPRLLAMDCEMVETKDPLTGKVDAKALARLSVIDGSNPSNVLIDTLVKPYWPVTDYRTRINGITASSLKDCVFTLRHAQKFMSDLCSSETVIAGHAVHNDLISLKMRHFRVIDSAFLFATVDGFESGPPSLKDAAKCVLGVDMPESHDSVNDARQSMALLQSYLDAGEAQKEEWRIVRTKRPRGGAPATTTPRAPTAGTPSSYTAYPSGRGTRRSGP